MGKYFGTDGFRGEANVDLNVLHAHLIGSYFGRLATQQCEREPKIVIGQDTRLSGDMFVNSLAAGITSAGGEAYVLGVTPTPAVSYLTKEYGFCFGIMVSASHNPYKDNGIKVLNCDGEKLSDDVITKCETYIDAGVENAYIASHEKIGTSRGFRSAHINYMDHLKSSVKHSFKGKKIAIDCSNGSASEFAGELFRKLGADVHVIHDNPNGININNNCGSTHIDALGKYVAEGDFDIGFAYDGDADRCLAVDSSGNPISGDELMLLCARRFKNEGRLANDTLVTTVMSNFGLYKALDEFGIRYEKTDVGDRFVYENMLQNNHCLGGEQSGHIIFSEFAQTGDGMLTSLMVVDSLIEMNETIEEAISKMRVYPQLLINFTVKDKQAAMGDEDVKASIADAEEMLEGDGRVLVRPSGTEPYIRVMAEASTDELCERACNIVLDVLKANGHGVE